MEGGGGGEEVITKCYFSYNDTIFFVLLVMMMYCIHLITATVVYLKCEDVCAFLYVVESEDCNHIYEGAVRKFDLTLPQLGVFCDVWVTHSVILQL